MRKIKEVLRLRFELGLGQRAIARACSISQSTVHEYLKRVEGPKSRGRCPKGWDEEGVENTLADGVVEENELNATIPKLEAVIQECASVRYLLETLCKSRKKKTKK